MNRLNTILTVNSLIVFAIIVERLTPTGSILLQPYNFISIHQLLQATVFIPAFIIVSVLLLKEFTNNFHLLSGKLPVFLVILFIVGVYLFGTGEGWHEHASFLYSQLCADATFVSQQCGALFINNYYAGNGIFFIGGLCMYLSLLTFSAIHPAKDFSNKDLVILLINSFVTALSWFAYAAFDEVFLGLLFASILSVISIIYLWRRKFAYKKYPYITYSAVAYTISTLATLVVRIYA